MKTEIETVQVLEITPSIARELLSVNTRNRNARANHVRQLSRDMANGNFQFNGDTIRIDRNGVLLDGQHRLMAIEQSETTQRMIVISGLEPEVMKTIDSGVKRTSGDKLKMSGFKNSNVLSACLTQLNIIARNNIHVRLTTSEQFEILEKHPGIEDSVSKCLGMPMSALSKTMACIHYIGHYTGYGDLADDFIETYRSGYHEDKFDPARMGRERILKEKTRSAYLPQEFMPAVTFATWEAKRMGKTLKIVNLGSQKTEPKVHGWGVDELVKNVNFMEFE